MSYYLSNEDQSLFERGLFTISGITKAIAEQDPNTSSYIIKTVLLDPRPKSWFLVNDENDDLSNSNRKESLTSIEDVIDRDKILDFKSKNFGDVLEQLSGVSSFKLGNNIVKPVLHNLVFSPNLGQPHKAGACSARDL